MVEETVQATPDEMPPSAADTRRSPEEDEAALAEEIEKSPASQSRKDQSEPRYALRSRGPAAPPRIPARKDRGGILRRIMEFRDEDDDPAPNF
jgi:hypothetical protein